MLISGVEVPGWNNGVIVLFVPLQSLTFQKISRIITAVDSQPTFDGGVLINVLGRLQVSFIVLLLLLSLNFVVTILHLISFVTLLQCNLHCPLFHGKMLSY